MPTPTPPRPRGLKLIIAWKFIKAPVMFALAIWLTVAPQGAYRLAEEIAVELSGGGATCVRIGAWIEAHLTRRVVTGGALLAWLDGVATTVEAVLLLIGKPWGEWLVLIGLATLVPIELVSLGRKPGLAKLVILAANSAIVIYLFRHRLRDRSARGGSAAS